MSEITIAVVRIVGCGEDTRRISGSDPDHALERSRGTAYPSEYLYCYQVPEDISVLGEHPYDKLDQLMNIYEDLSPQSILRTQYETP